MKLNHDCVRDVLLAIEALPYDSVVTIDELNVSGYDQDAIRYIVLRLHEAGFIDGSEASSNDEYECLIRSLTFVGHEFLDNIRPQETWDKTKAIASRVGSASLDVMANIAAQVTTSLISKMMGL